LELIDIADFTQPWLRPEFIKQAIQKARDSAVDALAMDPLRKNIHKMLNQKQTFALDPGARMMKQRGEGMANTPYLPECPLVEECFNYFLILRAVFSSKALHSLFHGQVESVIKPGVSRKLSDSAGQMVSCRHVFGMLGQHAHNMLSNSLLEIIG